MKRSNGGRSALCIAAFALSACGGAVPPTITNGVAQVGPTQRFQGRSWAVKGAATQPALLYITWPGIANRGTGTVTFYTYDNGKGLALQGTLTGFDNPMQPCVDKTGDVFIPDYYGNSVTEFAHGGTTPVQTLTGNGLSGPYGCAIDPKTGDLAVANFANYNILIYKNATGTPKVYTDPNFYGPVSCSYDNHGNLLVDVRGFYGTFGELALLPSGARTFTDLTLNGGTISYAGSVEWGGTHFLVVDSGALPTPLDRVSVSGSTATIVKQFTFPGSTDINGFWRRESAPPKGGEKIVVADEDTYDVQIFSFPGLSLLNTVTNGGLEPYGVVISQQGSSE